MMNIRPSSLFLFSALLGCQVLVHAMDGNTPEKKGTPMEEVDSFCQGVEVNRISPNKDDLEAEYVTPEKLRKKIPHGGLLTGKQRGDWREDIPRLDYEESDSESRPSSQHVPPDEQTFMETGDLEAWEYEIDDEYEEKAGWM